MSLPEDSAHHDLSAIRRKEQESVIDKMVDDAISRGEQEIRLTLHNLKGSEQWCAEITVKRHSECREN